MTASPFEHFQSSYTYQPINCVSIHINMQCTVWSQSLSNTFSMSSPTNGFPNRPAPTITEPQPSVHGGGSPINYHPYTPVTISSASSSDMPIPMDVDISPPPRHNAKPSAHDVRNTLRQRHRLRTRQERGQKKMQYTASPCQQSLIAGHVSPEMISGNVCRWKLQMDSELLAQVILGLWAYHTD